MRSRLALIGRITDLEEVARAVPVDRPDRAILAQRVKYMRSEYFGQTPFEMAVLAGLLDRAAAQAEMNISYPQ